MASDNSIAQHNVIAIPARLESTRLPNKVLLDLAGTSIIGHVIKKCKLSTLANRIIVATDNQRIVDEVKSHGVEAIMTRSDHSCGTDRIAEALADSDCLNVVNIQADEPFISPELIDGLFSALQSGEDMVTAACPLTEADVVNPSRVKVVLDHKDRALYFSRSEIPFRRDDDFSPDYLWHLGVYGYRLNVLQQITQLAPCDLEKSEKLEQLRALYHGIKIKILKTASHMVSIDTADDLELARELIAS